MIKNVKIIVVEQDPMIRDFFVDVLEFSVNREVPSFENGIEALSYIENNGNVDIVICAKDVSGISGIDLLTTIKTKCPDTICICISDLGHEASLNTVIDFHLRKPFDTKDLFNIVQRFVVEGKNEQIRIDRTHGQ
jgi:DNA-binding NtrC family response regulator